MMVCDCSQRVKYHRIDNASSRRFSGTYIGANWTRGRLDTVSENATIKSLALIPPFGFE
ncbi:hypothetical protein DSO57_1017798 [Entomophthora muscae]|uniref:Uncharacterized protein n=1 Tax=Entomophthora muscae TaxID=34485 RepID=A0ACC2RVQ6_9FUNG|nr:hypothetical protein DSO57_1017798 [Entomophthora muscae]